MSARVGVLLSGCGVFDGSEIHEATSILIALDRRGAHVTCIAPNVPQAEVINHLTKKPQPQQTPRARGAAMIQQAADIALTLIGLGMLCAFFRLVRGPTLPDRVVALDLIGSQSVALIAAFDIRAEQPVLLDAATVVALVAFLGTVAFAHYVERRPQRE